MTESEGVKLRVRKMWKRYDDMREKKLDDLPIRSVCLRLRKDTGTAFIIGMAKENTFCLRTSFNGTKQEVGIG